MTERNPTICEKIESLDIAIFNRIEFGVIDKMTFTGPTPPHDERSDEIIQTRLFLMVDGPLRSAANAISTTVCFVFEGI
jgi:hypothetical protein